MAKRFTATEKWTRPWFRSLPTEYKLLWLYICDQCDQAGIWYVDLELASFLIGTTLSHQKAQELLGKQIEISADQSRWRIVDFAFFQYGTLVNTNNMHRSVLKLLESWGTLGASQGLASPSLGAMDKEKDMVKDKGSNKDKDNNGKPEKKPEWQEPIGRPAPSHALIKPRHRHPGPVQAEIVGLVETRFSQSWEQYPSKHGRKAALKAFKASVATDQDWERFQLALEHYLESKQVADGYVMNGGRWFEAWDEWVDVESIEKTKGPAWMNE